MTRRFLGALALAFGCLLSGAQAQTFTATTIAADAAIIWRDYNTDGVPASGVYNPKKSDMRSWGAVVGGAFAKKAGDTLGTGSAASSYTFSASEQFQFSNRASNFTAYSVYNAISPGTSFYDGFQSAVALPAGSTIGQVTGFGSYVRGLAAASAGQRNSVGYFAAVTAEVDNAASWGTNTLCQDAATRTVGAGTGRLCIGTETDFNIMNPGSSIIGNSVGGNSLSQPTSALGYIVNNLGTGIKWSQGYTTMDGAASVAISLGALAASGTYIAGQPINMSYRDGSGTSRIIQMQATGGFLSLASPSSWAGLSIGSGNLYLSTGQGYYIGGSLVLSQSGSNPTMASPIFTGTTTTAAISASGDLNTTGNVVGTNWIGPTVVGGGTTSATLTLESTYAPGTTDSIILKTGSQVTRWTVDTNGNLKGTGHHFGDASGTAPTPSSCGTSPAMRSGSTDMAGEVTEGTTATGCTITFATAYTAAPFCVVTSQTGSVVLSYTLSTSAITITHASASSTKINYHCMGV